jgi:hypothetical protein
VRFTERRIGGFFGVKGGALIRNAATDSAYA